MLKLLQLLAMPARELLEQRHRLLSANKNVPDYSRLHIVLMILAHSDEPLTIKKLNERLPFSDDKVAYKLSQLEEDGYVSLERSSQDARAKIIRPTPKLVLEMSKLFADVSDVLRRAGLAIPLMIAAIQILHLTNTF